MIVSRTETAVRLQTLFPVLIAEVQKKMAAKTIIVTGAGRGIGLAVSQYLLQNSHKVVLVARTETELEALKKQYPAQVEYLAADLTKLEVRSPENRHQRISEKLVQLTRL